MVIPTPITVFTVEACPYCKQVTTSLEECKLPYTEISLSKYPQKRKDLLQLTGKVSVPQLFIHSEWIGGVDASLACLRDFANSTDWQQSHNNANRLESPLEKLEREVGVGNGAAVGNGRRSTSTSTGSTTGLNPRFMIPIMEEEEAGDEEESEACCDCHECGEDENDTANNNSSSSNSHKLALGSECHSTASVQTNDSSSHSNISTLDMARIETPNNELKTVREVTELLKEILPYEKRRWNFTTYKNCCTGEEIVDNLAANYDISRPQAEAFAKYLQSQHQILHHVCNKYEVRDSNNLFYRLQCFHTPFLLNSYRIWPTPTVGVAHPHPDQVLKRILKIFRSVEQACIEGHNGQINYRIAYMCAEFSVFEDAVCELQQVDLSKLKQGASMLAFSLNVFNLFLKYAFMKVGVPASESCRTKMMEQIKFQVGGYTFSLQEWVDGILRGNRKSPVTKTQVFGKKDLRLGLSSSVGSYAKDCRIHFAIHCWSRSRRSPPVKTYTAGRMEEELAFVTLAFCEDEDNVAFNTHDKKMRLAQVFRQYKSDFLGKTAGRTAPQVVVEFLYGPRRVKLEKFLRHNQTMKMSSRTEDWTLGVSDYVVFDAGRLTPNVKKFQKCVRSSSYRSRHPDSSRGNRGGSDMGSTNTKDQGSVDGSSLCSSQTTASGIGRWLPTKTRKVGNKASSSVRLNQGDSIPKSVIRSRGAVLVDEEPTIDVDGSEDTLLLDDGSNVSPSPTRF